MFRYDSPKMKTTENFYKEKAVRMPSCFTCHLKPASVEFAEDARRQVRRRTTILQVLANAADSVKSALPEGKLFSKIPAFMASSKLMRIMQAQH
ncbi:MAG: hypothetical protein DRH37_11095, partial [Deltaproteobacteria bacterium]